MDPLAVRLPLPRLLTPSKARRLAWLALVLVFGACAVAVGYAVRRSDRELAEFVLDSMALPVVFAAFVFRLRGGLLAAAAASSIGLAGFFAGDLFHPLVVLTSASLFVVLAVAVGWATETVVGQTRILARRDELSLELLATLDLGTFVQANLMWQDLLGYRPSALRGRRFLSLVHRDDHDAVQSTSDAIADGLAVSEQPLRFRHVDGHYLWIEWSARRDPDDRFTYIAGRDITARKKAEDLLALHQTTLEEAVRARTAELEQRTKELDLARREDLRRLAVAAEFRDDETAAHTERVGRLAELIAVRLGLRDAEVALLREAAPLHDIGKIGVPDAILLKPGRLTAAERQIMQDHTNLGAQILTGSNAPVLQVAAPIALHHHERWDGTGYPHGLATTEIPLHARIVALADTYDALTHERPYKPAWPISDALAEITSQAGRQFDPSVVRAFEQIPIEILRALTKQSHADNGQPGNQAAPMPIPIRSHSRPQRTPSPVTREQDRTA